MKESTELEIRLIDLIMSISDFVDLVSPRLENHHKQVSYIAYSIGKEMSLPEDELVELFIAGALHDIGAFSLKSRLDVLDFELRNPHHHAEIGYLLIKDFEPLRDVARAIRHHHRPWLNGAGVEQQEF